MKNINSRCISRTPPACEPECHDCHIPPDIPGMVKRKLEASNDIYQTFIAHSIDTPEKSS